MDLSLWNNNVDDKDNCANNGACSSSSTEMEHMFDKVVTPSDVGKLNRLVIPKHHAEKFFPLDHSSDEKDLLLNFEDRNGKPWRFRYSYWNSSQSYVMTKGWSRFVKEKKLDAGDIVSFHRRVGESSSSRLYIDWRRRTNAPDPSWFAHLELRNQMQFSESVRWGTLRSLPQSLSMPPHQQQSQFQPHFNRSIEQCHHYHHPSQQYHQYHRQDQQAISYGDVAATQYYSRPPCKIQIGGVLHHQQGGGVGGNHDGDDDHHNHDLPMVIGSVRPVHGKTVGKRLRLFGVNMECPIQDDKYSSSSSLPHLDSSSIPLSPDPDQLWSTTENSKKGKTTSLSFDLDL